MPPLVKAHTTSVSDRRERAAAQLPVQQAVLQAAHDALQQALDRRDNGGETGH
jgi:hypothetical protein